MSCLSVIFSGLFSFVISVSSWPLTSVSSWPLSSGTAGTAGSVGPLGSVRASSVGP